MGFGGALGAYDVEQSYGQTAGFGLCWVGCLRAIRRQLRGDQRQRKKTEMRLEELRFEGFRIFR
jgi:hypothetical protein